jgi:hypothetical protein
MVDDVLDYIDSYENIRAVCGLNNQELPDATLALVIYKNKLNLAFAGVKGVYPPSVEDEDLQTVYDRLAVEDEMHIVIQQLAIYVIADAVLDSVGLRAYKAIADGKATLTRFSAESSYLETRRTVKENISQARTSIAALFDEAEDALEYFSVVSPDVDLVVGES